MLGDSSKVSIFALSFRTRGVAQLASAPRSGRGGRKFESSHPDQLKILTLAGHKPAEANFFVPFCEDYRVRITEYRERFAHIKVA